jgi:hypothetical protein
MKHSIKNGLSLFALSAFVLAGCNSPYEPEPGITPADSPYVVDISTGVNLWDSGNTLSQAADGSVTITYASEKWPAWGINLYTGDVAGMDMSGYGTLEIVWEAEYPPDTEDEGADGNPNKQIKSTLLCRGLDPDANGRLEKYYGVETKTTATIDLATLEPADKRDIQQIVLQAKVPGTILTIYSITFKPLKDPNAGNVFSGSDVFWTSDDTARYTVETGVSYEGKTDVLKIAVTNKNWGPVRVDLSDYAEKTVSIEVSMNIWMDTASKIMWQVNASGYPVITGGNDSYAANEWVSFTGSQSSITLPSVEKDASGEVTGCPWFYLDDAGLKNNAVYYISDFKLTIFE